MNDMKQIKVSIVIPVYNVRQYIGRCMGVIKGQTLQDFEVICIDDGSSDGSGDLLDAYSSADSRIRVIHQSNSGAGVARNAGLNVAKGEYVFFFDPDDTCSRHMLKGMYDKAKKTNADIVIAGKCVVDAETGRIKAKYGFHRNIWKLKQPFSARDMAEHVFTLAKSVPWDKLFRREFIESHGLRFQDTKRSNDVYFVDMALALARRIALVPRAYYCYSQDREGSLQSAKDRTPLVFLEAYEALEKGLRERGLFQLYGLSFARVLWRTALFNMRSYNVPANLVKCYGRTRAIMLRLRDEVDLSFDTMLPSVAVSLYRILLEEPSPGRLASFLSRRHLDPEIDMEFAKSSRKKIKIRRFLRRVVPIPLREFVKLIRVRFLANSVSRSLNQEAVNAVGRKSGMLKMDFMHLTSSSLRMEFSFYAMSGGEPLISLPGAPNIMYCTRGRCDIFDVVPGEQCAIKAESLNEGMTGRHFSCELSLRKGEKGFIRWNFGSGPQMLSWTSTKYGLYAPLTSRRRYSYFRRSGWIVRRNRDCLLLLPDTFFWRMRCRCRLAATAMLRPSRGLLKAFILTIAARILQGFRRRPIWLFSDRPDVADDNARALFEYACSERSGSTAPQYVFAVNRNSSSFKELSKIGDCVDINSIRYKVLFLASDMIISAYRTPVQRRPFPKDTAEHLKWFFASRYRFVFLKHGVSPYNFAAEIGRWHLNARMVVASSQGEFADNTSTSCGYTSREVKLCGMARYDRLYDDAKNFVTFMPTWRTYLTKGAGSNVLRDQEPFEESKFCKYYKSIFSDDVFLRKCKSLGYKVRLMIHPNMVAAIDAFCVSPEIELVYPGVRYRDVFATSNLLVTDYSSVAFDMAYLKKPVLYYQFDEDEFFSRQYNRGYFDWRRDGFGEVETTAGALVSRIIEYLGNGCRMKPEYRKRVDGFFAFTDKNNCRRIYEAILEVAREDAR